MMPPNEKWPMANHKDWVWYAMHGAARAEMALVKMIGKVTEKRVTHFANVTDDE